MNTGLALDLLDIDMGSHGRNRLAMILATYADEAGRRVWPSVETMAARMKCSIRQVKRYLGDLRRAGLIVEIIGAGRGRSVEYAFNLARVALLRAGRLAFGELLAGRIEHQAGTVDPQLMLPGFEAETPAPSSLVERVTDVTGKGDTSVTQVSPEGTTPRARGVLVSNSEAIDRVNDVLKRRLFEAAGDAIDPERATNLHDLSAVRGWIEAGADLEADVLPMIALRSRGKEAGSVYSWAYFERAVLAAAARRTAIVDLASYREQRRSYRKSTPGNQQNGGSYRPEDAADRFERNRLAALKLFERTGYWDEQFGPKPARGGVAA